MNQPLEFDFSQSVYALSPEQMKAFLAAFERPNQALRELTRLAHDPIVQESYPGILQNLVERIPRLPDPDEALNHLDTMIRAALEPRQLFHLLSQQSRSMDILLAIAGQSSFLSEIVIRRPEYLLWLLSSSQLDTIKRWPHYRQEIEALVSGVEDCQEAVQCLRRYRRREVLRIAIRDILNLAEIEDTALELSNLADNIVYEVCCQALDEYQRLHGIPRTETGEEARFSVIALGKLGGRELNFSSDIDLMFVFDGEGRPPEAGFDNFEFFCRLAAELVSMLSTATDEGYLYRVDTRLRPEGSKGALVRSLSSLELYYESWGENWERQALLKARPIAGDSGLGERFLKTIKPFTFRKYVDAVSIHETLNAMSEMRNKTLHQQKSATSGGINVKTGAGGIRDVEFTVQAIQMLYGGQYPEIRCAGTVESLRRIRESGLLSEDDFDLLLNGYRFLRKVEHRLQMESELQVYTLPVADSARQVFARRLGYENWNEFQKIYKKHTRAIRILYDGIFAPFAKSDLFEMLLDESRGDQLLLEYHLSDAKLARNVLSNLSQDPQTPHLHPKIRRLFRQILPRLMDQIQKAPASQLALLSFDRIVAAVGARSSLYSTLAASPQFLELLIYLGSHSQYLTATLVRFPDLLDRLSDPAFLHQPLTEAGLRADHEVLIQVLPNADPADVLRRLKRIQMLKIGLRYLLRLSDVLGMTAELSTLASFILQSLLSTWLERYEVRYGRAIAVSGEPCRMALIGMGKLGGGEINFTSDLDLLFVYRDDSGRVIPPESGGEGIGVKEYFVRLAGDILKTLGTQTVEGNLYRSDVRLRPYGKGGDLAETLQQYRDYYQRGVAFWERQTLTKARWIAGDEEVGKRFLQQAEEFVYGSSLTDEDKTQIAHLRGRIERERKREELKSGEGGLIDVEFLVQAHQLKYGWKEPAIRLSNTLEALQALARYEFMEPRQAEILSSHYSFLRDIENRLQIMDGISSDQLPVQPNELEQLIRRLYHLSGEAPPSSEEFLSHYTQCRKEIRAIFEQWFSEE